MKKPMKQGLETFGSQGAPEWWLFGGGRDDREAREKGALLLFHLAWGCVS